MMPGDSSMNVDGSIQPKTCKRGIATNTVPSSALAIGWWYNWASKGQAAIEFVPMIWGAKSLGETIPANSKFLLGFNEPNFTAQANMTPAQAAANWPAVQAKAKALGIPLVSPAVNFCGGCSDPMITSPYAWLKAFFAACPSCQIDAVAVHWYNCDLPSLKGYLEGNGQGLEGFTQFGKPIWLTEFSCDGNHSVAENETYMKAAIPYLEAAAFIERYAWFSASPIPNARLMNMDGSLTDLGKTYVALPGCK